MDNALNECVIRLDDEAEYLKEESSPPTQHQDPTELYRSLNRVQAQEVMRLRSHVVACEREIENLRGALEERMLRVIEHSVS